MDHFVNKEKSQILLPEFVIITQLRSLTFSENTKFNKFKSPRTKYA